MATGYEVAQERIWQAKKDGAVALNLYNLELTAVPPEIGLLMGLTRLGLAVNQLTTVPPEISLLTGLTRLDLAMNKLTTVPPEITQLTGLMKLYLGGNQLTTVPHEITQLTGLTALNLYGNKLMTVPSKITQLTGLEVLDLSHNVLTVVPPEITQLTGLTELNLAGNQLTAIPHEIGQLTGLMVLDLYKNKLEEIPVDLKHLSNLQLFDLEDNQLVEVPEWLVQLPSLEKLRIKGNPIIQPPPELLGEALTKQDEPVDLEAVHRYYAQLAKEGEAYFYEAKLLLIGEGGAGKTSLARKLMNPAAPLPAANDSTKGIDIHQWQFPIPQDPGLSGLDQQYTANLWDFGGQNIYKGPHQFFFSKRSVYILLSDARRESSGLYDWLQIQEAFGAESPVLLLKNKNRESGSQHIIENLPHLQNRFPNLKEIIEVDLSGVPDQEAIAWADLLHHLQHHLLNLEHIGKPIPKTWAAIRNALGNDTRDSINRRDYLALCAEHGIDDTADALQLSRFLHDIGDILHYQDDNSDLADLIILNPLWALDAVYHILDNEEIGKKWGHFSYSHLSGLWNESKYDDHHRHLLELMQRFQLCYELPNQRNHYVAPQLLKQTAPAYLWNEHTDDLHLRYRYPDFMPRGILGRATVILHHRIENHQFVWRSGVLLSDGNARAELVELRNKKELHIRVSGKNKRDLLMEIVRTLDQLHEGFSNKLNYEKLVPCRCDRCIEPENEPHFFDLDYLRDRLSSPKERKHYVECKYKPYHDVHARDLIDDAILQMDRRGGDVHYHYDNSITVGNISNAQGVAIGRDSNATTTES